MLTTLIEARHPVASPLCAVAVAIAIAVVGAVPNADLDRFDGSTASTPRR